MGKVLSIICPFCPLFCGRWCFFLIFTPAITIISLSGKAFITLPVLPLSLPAITITLSFFFIFIIFKQFQARETLFSDIPIPPFLLESAQKLFRQSDPASLFPI